MPNIEEVTAAGWQQWAAENDAIVIDVREREEWDTGSIPGAVHMSLGSLPAGMPGLDRRRPVLLVCQTGRRSMAAARFLAHQGFRAANLTGGLVAIRQAV